MADKHRAVAVDLKVTENAIDHDDAGKYGLYDWLDDTIIDCMIAWSRYSPKNGLDLSLKFHIQKIAIPVFNGRFTHNLLTCLNGKEKKNILSLGVLYIIVFLILFSFYSITGGE